MISALGLVPNDQQRKSLCRFAPDERIKERLSYLQIPIVDAENEEEEPEETIEASDSLLFATPNTEEISALAFYVYSPEECYIHHDTFVFSTILDASYIGNGLVALGTFEPDVFVYDAFTRFPLLPQQLLCGHTAPVTGVVAHSGRLLSSSEDGSIIEWDVSCGSSVRSVVTKAGPIERFDFADGITAFGADNTIVVNTSAFTLEAPVERIRCFEDCVYVSDSSGTVSVFDPRNLKEPVHTQSLHTKAVLDIAFVKGCIATASGDSTVKIWKKEGSFVETGSFAKEIPVCCLCPDPSGRLFCGDENDTVSEIAIA